MLIKFDNCVNSDKKDTINKFLDELNNQGITNEEIYKQLKKRNGGDFIKIRNIFDTPIPAYEIMQSSHELRQ